MTSTILVVDDNASVRALLRDYLTEQGFRIRTAGDGQEALFEAREMKPDLILLDIMMPEMDGYEFIRAYRKERETPIILLTARLDETDKVVGLELGADDYVTKPFNMRELVARIRAVLRRGGLAPSPEEILRVGGSLRIEDHQIGGNPLQVPILVRPHELPDDVPLLVPLDAHKGDRKIAGDAVGPESGRAIAVLRQHLRRRA